MLTTSLRGGGEKLTANAFLDACAEHAAALVPDWEAEQLPQHFLELRPSRLPQYRLKPEWGAEGQWAGADCWAVKKGKVSAAGAALPNTSHPMEVELQCKLMMGTQQSKKNNRWTRI